MKALLLLSNMALFMITTMLLFFDVSNVFVSAYSVVIIISILVTFKVAHGNILGFGFVFIAYNILMHFGFGIIHFLIDDTLAKELYSSWVLTFLQSSNYSLAILISALAFEAYTIAWLVGLNKKKTIGSKDKEVDECIETQERGACYTFGMLMLAGVFFYFVILWLTEKISFDMSYMDYRDGVMQGSALYSWMLVLYPTGLVYVFASSNKNRRMWGVILFFATAIILLATGNKGEVFYVVLATLGIVGYQNKKIGFRLASLLCIIMFIVIPVVTSTRSTGVGEGFSLEFASLTDPFLEIGMQIRCVVFSIDHVASGTYSFMHGYSYLRPVCSVLGYLLFPLRYLPEIPIDLTSSKSYFYGYGFTQVAEGYLNFGITGAVLVFAILGYLLGRLEFKRMGTRKLCLVGSVLVILINASRNVFIFVPGQITLMLILYYMVKFISRKKTRR